MSTNRMKRLKELREEMATRLEEIKAMGQEVFNEGAQEIFSQHPELESFAWTQYTPYFNDGDECLFSAGTDSPVIIMKTDAPFDEATDDEWEWRDNLTVGTYTLNQEDPNTPRYRAAKDVLEFLSMFDEDDLRRYFDNHVTVTITRKGIEIEEYSHD